MPLFKKKQVEIASETELEAPKPEIKEEQFFRIDTSVEIPTLPEIDDKTKIDVTYPLIAMPILYGILKIMN